MARPWALTPAVVLLLSLVATAGGGVSLAASEAVGCGHDYGERFEELQALSGIETRWMPKEHMARGRAEEVRAQRSWVPRDVEDPTAVGSGDSSWLRVLFVQAREFVSSCWESSGRFWEVEVSVGEYFEGMDVSAREALDIYVQPEMRHVVSSPFLRISLCAPVTCDAASVTGVVLPRYLARALSGFDVAEHGVVLPPPSQGQARADELSDWSRLELDFAIVGVQKCGTCSLWQNLERHPEIGFTHPLDEDTDFFFTTTVQRRLLPLRDHVEAFNAGRWAKEGSRKPRIIGLRHSVLLQFPLARFMLAQIPRLVAVVIMCDPVGRAEKRFLKLCNDVSKGGDCGQEIVEFLGSPRHWQEHRERFWQKARVAEDLAETRRLFGKRLAVFHQDRLRSEPREFYASVATAIGATLPFDPRFEFGRYHAHRGHRTQLCHNATLVTHVRNALLGEYEAQERFLTLSGEPVPDVVRQRKTRCENLAELKPMPPAVGRCDQFTACAVTE